MAKKTLQLDTDTGNIEATSASSGGPTAITIDGKTDAYTVVAGDLGKVINCTANTFTVTLTAAATLGAGFWCWVWNTSDTSTHVVTIDPNASETIDGKTTLLLRNGEGFQIICDGTNWHTGDKKAMRGYSENMPKGTTRPIVTGSYGIGMGPINGVSANYGFAVGYGCQVNSGADHGVAIGANSGANGSIAAGAGAVALGGSNASGANSFAAAIGSNSSSYGAQGSNSIALGLSAKASSTHAVAIGRQVEATGSTSFATGYGSVASATYSYAMGYSNTASGQNSWALGGNNTASSVYSFASGGYANASGRGKRAHSSGTFGGVGDSQTGKMVLRRATTDATATVLTADNVAASTSNQVILPNYSTYAFTALVVARRTDANDESAGYEFKGVVDRNATAATTALVGTVTKTVLAEDTSAWDCEVTADTTNGGLAFTVTGEENKTIRWVATVWTTEVTG